MSRAEDLNVKVERATAQNFFQWYNVDNGRDLAFSRRPSNAPDFVYNDKDGEISLEITTVYYNQKHAKLINETARGRRKAHTKQEVIDTPKSVEWHSVDEPESRLIAMINRRLKEKCKNDYGSDCILVVRVADSALTTEGQFKTEVIPHVCLPEKNPFLKIYLTVNQMDYVDLV